MREWAEALVREQSLLETGAPLFCPGKFLDVHLAFAAEVDHLLAGEERPVANDAGCGGTLDELGIANGVGLRAANGRDQIGVRELLGDGIQREESWARCAVSPLVA